MRKILLSLAVLTFLQCSAPETTDKPAWIEEVRQAEKAFNDMAAEQGIKTAFLAFAAEDAVLVRGDQVIKGKAAMSDHFDKQTLQEVSLTWAPDFIDVSDDGSMAYTYGQYTFSAQDSSGQARSNSGIFHTVWKRQADGRWKFVYD